MRRSGKRALQGAIPSLRCACRRGKKAVHSRANTACRKIRPTGCSVRCRRRRRSFERRRRSNVVYTQCKTLGRATSDDFAYLAPIDTSRQTQYSFGIVNKGDNPIVVRLEISPNAVDYALDTEELVGGGRTAAIVPIRYLRFTRLGIRSQAPGRDSVVDIYYQAQSSG
ncbi:DUF6385 domain-containing protein [Cohnella sp. AR92]|uniref:DUF6385 domain-containing protein n=1 Tax=Cohnella sp. AR92 TaxID=648716 RepID=UPI000F8E8100|nr:DUF6385 domain-containing protein [Cohnella sp. AR92]RUS49102.1 hypothetical protein ELR57_01820 [Cohnella sp. AR92]